MRTTTPSIASLLNGLIEVCRVGKRAFSSAAENVGNEDFHLLFSDLSMQRRLFAGELERLVLNLGQNIEVSGSCSFADHRGWINLNAAISSGDDRAILAECERGEDATVEAYREALEQENLPPDVRSVVEREAMGVKAAHDRVHDLRDRGQ